MTTRVPVGAVLGSVRFTVPYFSGYGRECDTHEEAVTEARARKDRAWQQELRANRVYIEERWVMTWANPDGTTGSLDLVAERTEFAPDETREQWLAWRQQATT